MNKEDYIKEIEHLQSELAETEKKLYDYEYIIEDAIRYCECYELTNKLQCIDDLLDILKGGDE